jgi:hypothetical protein
LQLMQFNNPTSTKEMRTKNNHMKTTTKLMYLAFALFAFAGIALLPSAQAVMPPPDGGYPGGNTAEGNDALRDLTTGEFNTAVGLFSLTLNTEGSSNTGVGASTLRNDTTGNENTAVGANALRNNTTGFTNTAVGSQALQNNTTGADNTANGFGALSGNTIGGGNTANGWVALSANRTGNDNTATGLQALSNNTTGNNNTATGNGALASITTGNNNTAVGQNALIGSTGDFNIALGADAGSTLTTGDSNIYIGNIGSGGPVESQTIRIGSPKGVLAAERTFIAGINGVGVSGAAVMVNRDGQLGVAPSSARFKKDIKPMDTASEAILRLKPVSFHYQKDIDPAGTSQFGLVAEEVEKLNPDLVVHDKEGKPYTVRYDAVNAMLLNEFLKEHRKNEEQQKQIDALTAGLQKVSAQVEASKPAPQVVNNP